MGVLNWMEALSFYEYKKFLGRPNPFGRVPIILDGSNSFWLGPNHLKQVQIIKLSAEKFNLNVTKMTWIWPKQFERSKIILYLLKDRV